ncbi:hypothetical protein QTP70_032664, partial [Hemibagrus guttatus]
GVCVQIQDAAVVKVLLVHGAGVVRANDGCGLLFVFSFLRKVAWDYGRLALVSDADRLDQRYRRLDEREYVVSALQTPVDSRYERLTSVSSSIDFDQRDSGFCSWLTAIFRIKDDEIREKCGEDAVHYLSFQRHIIGLLVVVGVLSVGIILPVNFSGDLLDHNAYSFGRTTIANLKSGNNLLWLHTIFAFLYLLLTVYSMRRHTSKMHYKEDDLVKRTLFIHGINRFSEESQIKLHFEQAYENCIVLEARICYDVARLMYLDSERKKTGRSKKFYTDLYNKEHVHTMINPKPCGHLCCCIIKGCEQREAMNYYTEREAKLREDYKREKEKVSTKPLEMAFVTFQNEAMTAVILKDFNACKFHGCHCRREPKSSPFSNILQTHNWSVSYAPDPQNVYWEHLSISGLNWWLRCLIINSFLFLLLFFLTTPAIIISTMDKFNVTKPVEYLNYRDGQRELHCVFVDLEKAYDRVPREELWYCMRNSGVAEKYVRVVQDMYERSRTVVRCAVGQTEEFKVEVGLHQGSALSPFLFAIVMDQLSEEVRQESPWTMMFADDIVICSESREKVEENLERWGFALERRGMKVSRSKTEYMCVNEREGSGTVRLQGEEMKKVQEFKYLGSTVQSNGECGKENPIITQFFPTLLLWCFSALLPTIVYYSAFFEAHWTRSGENRTTMHKCYTFLIFMVLLLPSLGLSSLDVFFRWLFDQTFLDKATVRFECVFLPDNGAFFVNYVIASSFIGNALDLLRIPGLLMYMIRLCLARSTAERRNVKRHQAYEFQFGAAYAWLMNVFTVVMTYSITCPIIVPFGLMYMLLKHLVDRYNMYYAYLPSKLDKKIHSGAVNQVVAAPILCLFWLLFFSTVRTGFFAGTSMFTFVVLIITIIICVSHVVFGHFKYLSAHNYKIDSLDVDGVENGQPPGTSPPTRSAKYIAQVLQEQSLEESGSGSGEEYGQSSSQDDDLIVPGSVVNEADFQSGEDSLIDNEVHQ